MAESKHTPGPWKTCSGAGRGHCTCGFVTVANFPVAKVTIGKWGDQVATLVSGPSGPEAKLDFIEYGSVGEAEGLANARLIAVAPDLLEALSVLWRLVAQEYGVDGGSVELERAMFEAETAISKATGEASDA